MAEGKKPAMIIIAGVIELVFSICIFFYALFAGILGAVMGAGAAFGSAMGGGAGAEAAAAGAGISVVVNIILSLAAIVLVVIGIIGAVNLFKGKKAGVGLSNFWAIALFVIFAVGLIVSIIQMSSFSAAAGSLTEAAKSMTDTTVTVDQAQMQAAGAVIGTSTIIGSAFIYLLPAVVVFILLKLKPVKNYFAAPQA